MATSQVQLTVTSHLHKSKHLLPDLHKAAMGIIFHPPFKNYFLNYITRTWMHYGRLKMTPKDIHLLTLGL